MYILLVDQGRRLVTSDVRGLRLYTLDGEPKLVTELEQPGQRPFFEKSPGGERLIGAGDVVARSVTPLGGDAHWTATPTSVGVRGRAG